jgi:hypothetical protein
MSSTDTAIGVSPEPDRVSHFRRGSSERPRAPSHQGYFYHEIASLDTILQKVIELFDIDDAMLTSLIQGLNPQRRSTPVTRRPCFPIGNLSLLRSGTWSASDWSKLLVASAGGDAPVDTPPKR